MKESNRLWIPTDLERELLFLTTFNRELYGALFTHSADGEPDLAVGHYILAVGSNKSINGLDSKRVGVFNELIKRIKLGGEFYHTHPASGVREEVQIGLDAGIKCYDDQASDHFSDVDRLNFIQQLSYQDLDNLEKYTELLITHGGIKRYTMDNALGKVIEIEKPMISDHVYSEEFALTFKQRIKEVYGGLSMEEKPEPIVLERGLGKLVLS